MEKYQAINQEVFRAKVGSEKDMLRILDRFHPLILSTMEKYCPAIGEREDLIQEGRIGVMEGVRDFDPERGIPFPGYLKSKLKYLYLEEGRKRMGEAPLSLDHPDEDGFALSETVADDMVLEELFIDRENFRELREGMETLTDRQRFVIEAYYLNNLHVSEIAGFLGVSTSTVYNTKRRGLEKLRKFLE